MNLLAAETVVRAVLYEGYILYPYRPSSVKNRHRWMFGTLAPPGSVEASSMRTECLLRAPADAVLDVRVRFLQSMERSPGRGDVASPAHIGAVEAVEREVMLGDAGVMDLRHAPREQPFAFPGYGGESAVTGLLRAAATALSEGVFRLRVDVENTAPSRRDVDGSLASLASTHTLIGLRDAKAGEFLSLADPPDGLRLEASACRNVGTWPALLARDTVLSSPIILPDFPMVAQESLGDLFDATEIDEILTLRILTLTDAEKAEIRRRGGRGRLLLDRTEGLGADELSRLHGAVRTRTAHRFRPGDRVRLAPSRRADVFDLALAGRLATVASIEEDFEGQAYVTVTIEDDPGQDLGREGKPGHRFFFRTDEVEPLS